VINLLSSATAVDSLHTAFFAGLD